MSFDNWLAFTVAFGLVLFAPGPSVLVIVSYAIAYGKQATVCLSAAVVLGNTLAFTISLAGVGVLLAASPIWFDAFKWLAGIYLLALAVKLLGDGHTPVAPNVSSNSMAHWQLFWNTFFATALSPTSIVFNTAILPKFISKNSSMPPQFTALILTVVCLSLLKALLYTFFASWAKDLLTTPIATRRCNLIGGSLMSAAGIWVLSGL